MVERQVRDLEVAGSNPVALTKEILTYFVLSGIIFKICRGGGIGRHVCLRGIWANARAGSSPALGTRESLSATHFCIKGVFIIMEKIVSSTDPSALERASKILKEGGVIVFPTETVYGVGALLDFEDAIKRVYEIKGRTFDKPLLIHLSNMANVFDLARYVSDKVSDLMKTFWPGSLSIILEASCAVPKVAISYGYTVGLRMPSNDFFRKLSHEVGPIAATSANLSNHPSPLNVQDAYDQLKDSVDLYIDDGKVEKGVASTIIDMTVNPPKILRVGSVNVTEIEKIIGKVTVS